jgi:polar amino acid transport system substrate-binding protein
MTFRTRGLLAASAAAALLALTACADNTDDDDNGGSGDGGAQSCTPAPTPSGSPEVPADIQAAGKLIVGTDASYAPNEYQDDSGRIVGFDIDLFTAVAQELGLEVEFQNATFDTIVAGVAGGKYDVGVSSFTDTCEREKVVDFVDYFNAGTQWAAAAGTDFDPDDACGRKVAVQTGTVQDLDDLPARQGKCKADGKDEIEVLKFEGQADATTAVVLGQAEAMLADSPVTAYAVKQSEGELELVGDIYDAAPYGYAIPKDTPGLTLAIRDAVEALIEDGTYQEICERWGVEAGAVESVEINGAS